MFQPLNKHLVTTVLTALLGSAAPMVSAEWLSFFSPKASGIGQGAEVQGLESFNALGCGECHQDIADSSYKSGFRVVTEKAAASVAEGLDLPHSPASATTASAHSLKLADRTYIRSSEYSAVFIRESHAGVPSASASLRRFERASDAEQQAAVEYLLMF